MKNSIKLLSGLFLIGIVTLCFTNSLNAQDVLSIEDMNSVYKNRGFTPPKNASKRCGLTFNKNVYK